MKVEFYDQYLWPVRAAAGRAVGDWVERVYNRHRPHSALGWSARSTSKTDSIRRHKPPDPVSACVTNAEGSVIGELLKAVLCRR